MKHLVLISAIDFQILPFLSSAAYVLFFFLFLLIFSLFLLNMNEY